MVKFNDLTSEEKYDLVNDPKFRNTSVGGHSYNYKPKTHGDLTGLVDSSVSVHKHKTASASVKLAHEAGEIEDSPNIYSVLGGRMGPVQGHVTDIGLFDPRVVVDRSKLNEWRQKQAYGSMGKTRHLGIQGTYRGEVAHPGGRSFIPMEGGNVTFKGGGTIYSPDMFDRGLTNSEQFADMAYLGKSTGIIEQDCIDDVQVLPGGGVSVTKKNVEGC